MSLFSIRNLYGFINIYIFTELYIFLNKDSEFLIDFCFYFKILLFRFLLLYVRNAEAYYVKCRTDQTVFDLTANKRKISCVL